MSHTYTSINIHYVFSTKNREKLILPAIEERLWAYMGGIAKENLIVPLAIGGTNDHVHLLLRVPTTLSIAKTIQLIKGGSSNWVHSAFPQLKEFSWQKGYGAFSVSISQLSRTINYIRNQKEHHRKRTFKEEYRALLKKNGIEYDERYIWD